MRQRPDARCREPAATRSIACVGLGYGDEGKGRVVDYLVRARAAGHAVRFGGGPQAAHHVVDDRGEAHCFAQLPAGMLVTSTRGVIGRDMLIDPPALLREARALARRTADDPLARLSIDPACRVVTPLQKWVGQLRELARGAARRGTCGRGVSESVRDAAALGADALRVEDLGAPATLRSKLRVLRAHKLDHAEQLARDAPPLEAIRERLAWLRGVDLDALAALLAELASSGARLASDGDALAADDGAASVIFEGAHGVLLDPRHGEPPHVTATDNTFAPADALADRAGRARPLRLGVVRAYATRHGRGPLPTEDPAYAARLPEPHNVPNEWQETMRAGPFDLDATRRAIDACGGVDAVALTCLDRCVELEDLRCAGAELGPARRRSFGSLRGSLREVRRRDELPAAARAFVAFLESREGLGVPLALIGVGPSARETIVGISELGGAWA